MLGGCKHARSANLHWKTLKSIKKQKGGGCPIPTGGVLTPPRGVCKNFTAWYGLSNVLSVSHDRKRICTDTPAPESGSYPSPQNPYPNPSLNPPWTLPKPLPDAIIVDSSYHSSTSTLETYYVNSLLGSLKRKSSWSTGRFSIGLLPCASLVDARHWCGGISLSLSMKNTTVSGIAKRRTCGTPPPCHVLSRSLHSHAPETLFDTLGSDRRVS